MKLLLTLTLIALPFNALSNDGISDRWDNDRDNDGISDRWDNDMDNDGISDRWDNDHDWPY